jgi:hypothetical protein
MSCATRETSAIIREAEGPLATHSKSTHPVFVAKSQQPKPKPNGTAKFSEQTAAQRRLAAKQAVARASASRAAQRKRRWATVYTPIIVVLVIVLVMVLVKALGSSNNSPGHTASDAGEVATLVTSVPSSDFDTVGVGTAQSPPKQDSGTALTADGKPKVLYVGAEWCPFCAAERWPLTVALSRFGTFTGLEITKSTPNDVYPNTPTLSYAHSTFTSQYVYFDANEIEDGDKNTIKTLSAENQNLFTAKGNNSFPFIDIGGSYLQTTAQFSPELLAGKSQLEVAQSLTKTDSNISQAVLGAANAITAAICKVTQNQPQNVCTSSGVTSAANTLQ